MRRLFPFIAAFLLLAAAGCGKDSPTSSRVFTDSLTLGKGLHGIDLTGETYTFTVTHNQSTVIYPTIYWRAESRDKMKSADITFKVEQLTDFGLVEVYSTLYELTKLDDNVVISSYYHMYGVGTFRATATLEGETRVLGVKQFTVDEAK
jgi:hypothetical protein